MARRDSIMKKPKDARGALRRLLSYLGAYRIPLAVILTLCLCGELFPLIKGWLCFLSPADDLLVCTGVAGHHLQCTVIHQEGER